MSKIFEGDEWKYCDNKPRSPIYRMRIAEQEHIDTEFCNGRMTQREWRSRTDEMSEPTKWNAAGKI